MPMSISLGMGLSHISNSGLIITPPYPAPTGYTWFYETFNGQMVMFGGQPTLFLMRTS